MCGFAGVFGEVPESLLLEKMGNAILHRGPDGSGVWIDDVSSIGFSHRRLAIVDLSEAGHQPMKSSSERYVIAFNGEIYNHLELRNILPSSINWRGYSDTETLLEGFEVWGIEGTLKQAVGMFALAIWDKHDQTLTLARDRLGEKPLYYGWQGQPGKSPFLFGSELKALKVHPGFNKEINRSSLSLLLRYNYIPAPYCIYSHTSKLQPGCMAVISVQNPEPQIKQYWSAVTSIEEGISCVAEDTSSALDNLESVLTEAVKQQMMADVPLGAFLSGGVDSSTIVALMQAQSSSAVKTFTIGFNEKNFNEAEHAKAVARHLGTDHTEMYISSEQALSVIPLLPSLYDEPFADSSQIPTFLVSKLARQHVTVSLSGDAGDELFCGYNRYLLTNQLWRKLSRLPVGFRSLIASGMTSISPSSWNTILAPLNGVIPAKMRHANIGDKLHKSAGVLAAKSIDELYLGLVSPGGDPSSAVLNAVEPNTLQNSSNFLVNGANDIERMMALDLMTYLPDDILVKVDRAAMGVSLETRVPMLDHRVVEYAWKLPQSMKLRDGQSKWALRQILYRYVPKELIERPKVGFGIPLEVWLRGPLREWAEELLDEKVLRQEGYFNVALVRLKWSEHLSGKRNWSYWLWGVLMFQAWLREQH